MCHGFWPYALYGVVLSPGFRLQPMAEPLNGCGPCVPSCPAGGARHARRATVASRLQATTAPHVFHDSDEPVAFIRSHQGHDLVQR